MVNQNVKKNFRTLSALNDYQGVPKRLSTSRTRGGSGISVLHGCSSGRLGPVQ